MRPTTAMRAMAGDEEFYVEYFQEPGRAEAEIEADVRDWLLGFMFTASGDAPPPDLSDGTVATVRRGGLMKDRFHRPDPMPAWLTEADLDVYASEFEHSGLRGPLNRYRNVDRDWEDLAAFRGARIDVPSLFIGGDRDGPTMWGAPAIAAFEQTLPKLHRSIILEGCGHWTQQERPDEVNAALSTSFGACDLPAPPSSISLAAAPCRDVRVALEFRLGAVGTAMLRGDGRDATSARV